MASYQFIKIPAKDESVDTQWDLKTPTFQNTPFSIQDCFNMEALYSVGQYFYDAQGNITAFKDHGEHRDFEKAKKACIRAYEAWLKEGAK